MYNKLYDFPLVIIKECIPDEFQIDDGNDDINSSMSATTRSRRGSTGNGHHDSEVREERATRIKALNRLNDDDNKDPISDKIAAVERTHLAIQNFEFRLAKLTENKRKLRRRHSSASKPRNEKKRGRLKRNSNLPK